MLCRPAAVYSGRLKKTKNKCSQDVYIHIKIRNFQNTEGAMLFIWPPYSVYYQFFTGLKGYRCSPKNQIRVLATFVRKNISRMQQPFCLLKNCRD